MRLAALWGCTKREAQERCDSAEFTEWIAFDSLQPFGDYAQDVRDAMLIAAIKNQGGRRGKRFKVDDFRLCVDPKSLPDSATLKQQLRSFFDSIGTTDARRK